MSNETIAPRSAYLALGDSYTIGEAVEESARWPMQLASRLRENGISLDDPQIIATTGWTTDELAAAMDEATLAPHYGLVSLSIGVNNQYRGRPLDNLRREFSDLLERAIGLSDNAPERVFVVSIPDWGVTPFAHAQNRDVAQIAREIDAFNGAQQAICASRGVLWIDVTDISRTTARSKLADDGLHPSAGQYGEWVERMQPLVMCLFE
jgi:lysophospholipase L1-like esterase